MVLFKQHSGRVNANSLLNMLYNALSDSLCIAFADFICNMTLVTDSVNFMLCIVGLSTFLNTELDECCLPCIVHLLNTVMYHVVVTILKEKRRAGQDMEAVKTIVRIAKNTGWNSSLPDGED